MGRGLALSLVCDRRAFGEVYSAVDRGNHDQVAIKVLKRDAYTPHIEREGELLKKCTSNYIIRIRDVIITEEEVWVDLTGLLHLCRSLWNSATMALWRRTMETERY